MLVNFTGVQNSINKNGKIKFSHTYSPFLTPSKADSFVSFKGMEAITATGNEADGEKALDELIANAGQATDWVYNEELDEPGISCKLGNKSYTVNYEGIGIQVPRLLRSPIVENQMRTHIVVDELGKPEQVYPLSDRDEIRARRKLKKYAVPVMLEKYGLGKSLMTC